MSDTFHIALMKMSDDNTATNTYWQVPEGVWLAFRDVLAAGTGSEGNTTLVTDVEKTTDYLSKMPSTARM